MKRSEKRSKSKNNNTDRISELPEDLIQRILCLLPTKVAITTSVLSKQWQSHWKNTPKIKFDGLNSKLELENLCNALLSHEAPVIQSFHLNVRLVGRNNLRAFRILIGIALTRNLRELVLKVYSIRWFIKFPSSFYDCGTLETLKLMLHALVEVPSSVSLRSLKTLVLHGANFVDEKSVVNLLSGCPNLQELVVCRDSSSCGNTFTIVVPSLQRLTIHNGYATVEHDWLYKINTPSLKFLKIEGSEAFVSCLFNAPELTEVNITSVPEITDEKLLIVLTSSVRRLSLALSPLKFKFPIGCIFEQLVYLELFTYKKQWWDLLTFMLDSSPKLQVLKLVDEIGCMKYVGVGKWNQPQNVPECLFSHLETFMWKGYKWDREEEIEVAKYILKNTNRLKRATFSSKRISYQDRLEVVNDLKSVVKDTNACKFEFI